MGSPGHTVGYSYDLYKEQQKKPLLRFAGGFDTPSALSEDRL